MSRWIVCVSKAIISVEADTADQALIVAIRTLGIFGIDPFGFTRAVRRSACMIIIIKGKGKE